LENKDRGHLGCYEGWTALNTIKLLFEKSVTINVLNLEIIANTTTGRLIFTIFIAFVDFERDLILEPLGFINGEQSVIERTKIINE